MKTLIALAIMLCSAPAFAACTANPLLITTCGGAVGDGTTDNQTAIQNTFNSAASQGFAVEIPAGNFAHSGVVNANGIVVFGLGSASILKATTASNSALELTGNGGSYSNFVVMGTGSSRLTNFQASGIWVNGATNFTVTNILVNGGSCVGIWDEGGSNGTVSNNTVENTLADSITNTNGASTILDQNNLVINSGDDGISNNSYTTDSNTVNHITVNANTILANAFARGLEVSGGTNISFTNNYVDDKAGDACIILASETSSFQTQTVNTVMVTGNTLVDCGPDQGSLFFWPDGSGNIVENVTANGNQFYAGTTQTFTAVQVTGTGTLTNDLVENSNAYLTPGPSFFSSSFTGTGSITQTANSTFAKTAYPGPIATPTGGNAPIFSLPGGTYTFPQSLTLNDPTSGDAISYCATGGSSCTPGTSYTGAITVSSAGTVCASAVNSSSLTPVTSAVICAAYSGGLSFSITGQVGITGNVVF